MSHLLEADVGGMLEQAEHGLARIPAVPGWGLVFSDGFGGQKHVLWDIWVVFSSVLV